MLLRSVKFVFILIYIVLPAGSWAQPIAEKLTSAYKTFAADAQLRNSSTSLYVLDATTGQVVFDKNGTVGLVPASTQKIITSVSAYELLGENFKYQTRFAYQKNKAEATLLIVPSGDPTFGSWRWPTTTTELRRIGQAIKNAGIHSFREIIVDNQGWQEEAIPDGWIWQDIGNYYGAGSVKLNWRENQFDVILKSGAQIGGPVTIVKTIPPMKGYTLRSELTAAATGTGDKAFIYFPLNETTGVIRGTIPINENKFKISGAMPAAAHQFASTLLDTLARLGIKSSPTIRLSDKIEGSTAYLPLHTVTSPPLDSINYWFIRKSINLYGEVFVKTLAFGNKGQGSTDKGIAIIRDYWKNRGIPESELNMVDGSGLSPLNRVTTHAQVKILQHAQKQTWFKSFYAAFPLYNGMKMKSGTIRGAKGFCGYHRATNGRQYIFSFLVNNYDGSPAALVQKMYKVLDTLK